MNLCEWMAEQIQKMMINAKKLQITTKDDRLWRAMIAPVIRGLAI